MPRNGIAGSPGKEVCNFVRYYQISFCRWHTILHWAMLCAPAMCDNIPSVLSDFQDNYIMLVFYIPLFY